MTYYSEPENIVGGRLVTKSFTHNRYGRRNEPLLTLQIWEPGIQSLGPLSRVLDTKLLGRTYKIMCKYKLLVFLFLQSLDLNPSTETNFII